jgi:RNA polymerase sigma factor (sigma-70 family)
MRAVTAMPEPETPEERLAALMRSAQGGDAGAYGALMQELAVRVRQIVRHRRAFLERADVEDLVQEVLLSVHAVRATYDPSRPFIPWLLAITRNRLADAARRYARHGAYEVAVDDLDVTFFSENTNILTTTYGDPDALREAIAELPAGQRTAIEMLKLREMSLKEAAAASGTSVGALKVATHRAMDALRRKLKKEVEGR